MKTKAQKEQFLADLRREFDANPAMVVCKFEGLNVAEDQALRSAVRAQGGTYRVVANRLAHLAAKGTAYETTLEGQRGMTALAFLGDDPVATLKALVEFAKREKKFSYTSGVVDGRALDLDGLDELSRLPDLEGLQVRLLYLISSSAQRLVSVLNAPGRDVAAVLQQAVEKQKFDG